MAKLLKKLSLFFLCAFFLSACTPSQKGTKPSKIKKEICTNFIYSPLTLDPRKTTDPVSISLHLMLYEGLMRLNSDGNPSFALADSVTVSEDRRVYTFHLKKSQWSNGDFLTAFDFENSWKRVLCPDFISPVSHLFFPILNGEKAKKGLCSLDEVGVHAKGSHTLVVELEKPLPYFLELVTFPTYFPTPFCGREVEIPQEKFDQCVTNGPFRLASFKIANEVVVEKNPHFHNEKEVKIDGIRIPIVSDEKTALQLFEQGELDWLGGLISPLPIDAMPSLTQAGLVRVQPIASINFCAFNTKDRLFKNVHIRRAFSYAINRKSIIENVTQMFDEVATGVVPPILKNRHQTHFFKDADGDTAKREFDVGLEELGMKREEFPSLTYIFFSSEIQKKIATVLQNQWREILGVNVSLQSVEIKSFFSKLRQKEFEFAQMSWIAQFNDKMSFLERFITETSSRNYSSWESARFQELIQNSSLISLENQREALLEQAEHLILEEMPIAPINHYKALYLINPHLKGVQISPLGNVDFRYADIAP